MRFLLFTAAVLWTLSVSAAEPAPAEVVSHIDTLYLQRGSAEANKALDEAISAALKAHPEDYEVLWRAARARWWIADGAADSRLKKQLGKEAWNLAERAVKANPKHAAGHYYAAVGIGAYSQAVGIVKALSEGLEGKFNGYLDKAIELDADFERSGGLITKGRYYYELPWPKRDLDKAVDYFKKALAKHPENIRAGLYLAEALLKDDEPEAAKTAIEKVLAGQAKFDPAEDRRVKSWAKQVRAQIEEELK